MIVNDKLRGAGNCGLGGRASRRAQLSWILAAVVPFAAVSLRAPPAKAVEAPEIVLSKITIY